MWKHLPNSGFMEFESYPLWSSLLIRNNFDIFRFQCDFLLILLIVLALPIRWKYSKWLTWILTVGYLFLLSYNIYYEFSVRLYGGHPYFENDLALAIGVLPTFLKEIGFGEGKHLLLYLIVGLLLLTIVYAGCRWLLQSFQRITIRAKEKYLIFSIVPILLLGTIGHHIFPNKGYKNAWKTVQWTWPKIFRSMDIPNSASPHTVQQLQTYSQYNQIELETKPNVYLIFVESYGAVPFYSEYATQHLSFMSRMDSTIKTKGWSSVSTYSNSPIIGGRSWLGFTTAITGINVESQIQYLHLLENFPDYPHLTRWFKMNDYLTYRMKTMSNVKKSTSELYKLSEDFFGFDTWIKHEDIGYTGFKYDEYFGGVPDQFALDMFHDKFLHEGDQPYFMFFITMNSHIPWRPTPPIVKDFKKLNDFTEKPADYDKLLETTDIIRYHKTIEYSLTVVQNFMTTQLELDSNCVFILIGDHQPPTLEYVLNDSISPFAVPLHIMSKDIDFTDSFVGQGFSKGMIPNHKEKVLLNHAGFYSLFVNRLIHAYGKKGSIPPDILMDGLD